MISMLRGRIWKTAPGYIVLDVNGVGYTVYCMQSLFDAPTENDGSEITLLIETVMREDAINFYGFETETEKTWFQVLTGVQGVGGKVALTILGHLSVDGLLTAIAAGDSDALRQVKGIGDKLAKRIVTELKGSVGEFDPDEALDERALDANTIASAKAALMKLGYKASEAGKAAKQAAIDGESTDDVSAIVRRGLMLLS